MNTPSRTDQSQTPPSAGAEPGPITVRYWAGARAAAGLAEESAGSGPVADVVAAAVQRHPGAAEVLAVCAVLVDGRAVTVEDQIPAGAVVDLLPPFAGG